MMMMTDEKTANYLQSVFMTMNLTSDKLNESSSVQLQCCTVSRTTV